MAPESLELLEMLREHIVQGRTGREELLRVLCDAVRDPSDSTEIAVTKSAHADLLDWIDLARHLFV